MNIYTKKEVKNQLLHPRKETKGYTRWWWFGCAVDKEEIKRELDYMLEAEIGGVELQILYPICADDTERGIQNQQYLSPGFFTYIKYACEEAKKRGLKFDFTLGSSWPYGGPFVPIELSAPNVIPYTIDVKGPCQYSYDFTTRLYGECVACVMGEMEDCKMIPETIVDITDKVIDKYLFNWEWGKELTTVEIPEGNYKIVIFLSSDKRQTVLKPLPNGDGLIIDHNRKDAVRLFLEHGGDPIAEQLGEGMVQSYFCDSIEVFGQNWTDIVYEEFQKRRGYELRPFVYALWGEVKDMTDLIRYDFQKTLGELTVENFFQEVTKWCHEKGTTSRMQAHGTWGDVLLAYGAADIPEGETFSEF
ncbi:MAG: glycosyl hydrolase, partial [Lachnospiraceae bacterium]